MGKILLAALVSSIFTAGVIKSGLFDSIYEIILNTINNKKINNNDKKTNHDKNNISKSFKMLHKRDPEMRELMKNLIYKKQEEIVNALQLLEEEGDKASENFIDLNGLVSGGGKRESKKFIFDSWERKLGGGGRSCVLQDGAVFEKAGVNVSVVDGILPRSAVERMRADHGDKIIAGLSSSSKDENKGVQFSACGLSMVIHPRNPHAPTVHLNYRYFETGSGAWWFGGGADLTPSYLYEEDAIQFHKGLKSACDSYSPSAYSEFKAWCDSYFSNTHRGDPLNGISGESRGIGGIFFDDLDDRPPKEIFNFIKKAFDTFIPTYIPIVRRRKDTPFTAKQKDGKQIRRGRYVEFNLVHDRGTAFGLRTPGSRIESILISLPLTAEWKYKFEPEEGSEEAKLLHILKYPKEWV